MGLSSDIPVRANGETVDVGWWNIFRTKLLGLLGDGALSETSFVVANNQAVAANVTGMLASSTDSRSAVVKYDVKRKTDTGGSEVRAVGTLVLGYRGASWEILGQDEYGDAHGVTFTVTAAGQVQYTSTNIAGANYVGQLRFRMETFND